MVRTLFSFSLLLSLTGCSSYPPIKTVESVDLKLFMGDWYVIANIPTFIETSAHNAVESYSLNENGSIATTFTFRDGGFDGEKKSYHPTGYIIDTNSNAIWGMQFIWPVKADYRVLYLNDDYSQTVIGRIKRDYVWIMARTPSIPDEDYKALIKMLAEQGYDTTLIKPVPQQWN